MQAKKGDHIVVESPQVGQPAREGEVLEVRQGEIGVRLLVRWSDGHESLFTPSAGSTQVVERG